MGKGGGGGEVLDKLLLLYWVYSQAVGGNNGRGLGLLKRKGSQTKKNERMPNTWNPVSSSC